MSIGYDVLLSWHKKNKANLYIYIYIYIYIFIGKFSLVEEGIHLQHHHQQS